MFNPHKKPRHDPTYAEMVETEAKRVYHAEMSGSRTSICTELVLERYYISHENVRADVMRIMNRFKPTTKEL